MPLLVLGLGCLLGGGWGGLWRAGWLALDVPAHVTEAHGPAMVGGFLGAVIGLERAVALGTRWGYGAPLLCGLGGLLGLLGIPAGAAVMLVGSAVFVVVNVALALRVRAVFSATVALGSVALVASCTAWVAGVPFPRLVTGWLVFPVLTIVGERLELSRMMPPTRWGSWVFAGAVGLLVAGAVAAPWAARPGGWLFASGLVLFPVWAAFHDVVTRTVRGTGLPRYVAVCVLGGYAWMVVGAVAAVWNAGAVAGPAYDAFVHALTMGLVFAMVFGHAPIMVPALLQVRLPYHRGMWAPLGVLHASLAMRVAGDVALEPALRLAGAAGNAVAVLGFVLLAVATVRSAARRVA